MISFSFSHNTWRIGNPIRSKNPIFVMELSRLDSHLFNRKLINSNKELLDGLDSRTFTSILIRCCSSQSYGVSIFTTISYTTIRIFLHDAICYKSILNLTFLTQIDLLTDLLRTFNNGQHQCLRIYTYMPASAPTFICEQSVYIAGISSCVQWFNSTFVYCTCLNGQVHVLWPR